LRGDDPNLTSWEPSAERRQHDAHRSNVAVFKRDPESGETSFEVSGNASDGDRVAFAAIEFGNFHAKTNGGEPFTVGEERRYNSFEDFAKDVRPCLLGWGGWNENMPAREELERAWALYCHTAAAYEGKDNLTVFGRNRDIYDTALLNTLRGSSEVARGILLFMEGWNPLMNAVWVTAAIKAGFTFATVSELAMKTRQVS